MTRRAAQKSHAASSSQLVQSRICRRASAASTPTWPMSSRPSASAREFLLSLQHPDGYWCGELEADSMLEADYIFLHTLLESGDPGRLAARMH